MAATATATAGGNMSLSSIIVFDDMMFLCHHVSKVTNASWNGNPLHSSFSLLMFQICLMFVSSRTVRFLLKPLKQSRLVTDVIGAIILGPTVLGHSAAFTSTAFPARGTVILRTFGILGLVYFIFIIGIKMDTKLINLSDRKILLISSTNVLLPFVATMSAHRLLSPYLTGSLAHPSVFVFVAITISLTLFPNVIHILSELKLLNTELAQLSASCAMLNASVGWLFIVLFIFLRERAVNPAQSIKAMACVIVIIAFIAYVYHPWATRVTRRTPNGGRVRDGYVFAIILFVPLVGICFDAIGGSMADGALFVGLATPDGPPLGSAIVEKMEAIVGEVLMPLMMLLCGLEFDLFQVQDWRTFGIVMVLLFTAYIGKLVGTLLPCLYCKMSFRSSLVFSLVMGFKGTIELFYYMWWLNEKMYSMTLSIGGKPPLVVKRKNHIAPQ
ncbi:Cation/H(+) antiporter 15 [Acorus calamus]|uniref:Cation/H(+) antiporter 15 n=1 Tax=Acorus calamus TaxID=4465 RepID=A0AAV9C7R1_ACOCL|nr:Cation/H(+) antiporter 15 [Acorus calamus]